MIRQCRSRLPSFFLLHPRPPLRAFFFGWLASIVLTFAGPALSQTLLGSDIDGENAGDQSGSSVSLSSDGTRVAIGAYANDGNKGHVRVYENSGGKVTTPIGSGIDRARSVALQSDGKIVAAGGSNNLSLIHI